MPSFDVASVKLSSPDEHGIGMFVRTGGKITATNYTLSMLIYAAYGVEEFQILNGPKWVREDRYSIVAAPPSGSQSSKLNPVNPKLPPPEEELLMLKSLLASRFKLVVHEESREGSVLALVVGKEGPKLATAKNNEAFPVVMSGRTDNAETPAFMGGQNASMARFATRLSQHFRRPVLDQTGLTGSYDFRFEYAGDMNDQGGGVSLFSAIQQLGLKLVQTKGPVPHLVIDHAEKPDAN